MVDAYSRRLLSIYLTFDPPSYRSVMMVLRVCVQRFERLPQSIVVDGGREFHSVYFDSLLARYRCIKKTRPWAKPHFGSVCERLFKTTNDQFIYTLLGNTQTAKRARLLTRSVDPKHHALWMLPDLYTYLFGKLSGQTARRCLPVHFPRYQLEREEDCVEFQSTLLELLRRVPLECPAERWVADHWLYFYECSIGCIGLLKDWLLRAVSTALGDGKNRLSLDCVADHALPVVIYRQMALDAYEGEQRLNHTEVNREHVWRLLQGGELIAPVPPLPPREVPDVVEPSSSVKSVQPGEQLGNGAVPPMPLDEAPLPTPPVKKMRTPKRR